MAPKQILYLNLCIASILLLTPAYSLGNSSFAECPHIMDGFQFCRELSELNATLNYKHNRENSSLSVAFAAAPPDPAGWVAWGINPTASGMVGSQVIATYRNEDKMEILTLDIKDYDVIVPSKLSFPTWDLKAEEIDGVMKIYASVKLPENSQGINMTWQVGPSVKNGKLVKHDSSTANRNAKGWLSLAKECAVKSMAIFVYQISYKLGWTIFFFTSLLIEKYVDIYPSAHPWWFYLHAGFQVGGYAVGAYSWGISMILASEISEFGFHLTIGTVIFIFATAILIYKLFFMPNKDHRNGSYWNLANKLGYLVILIGVVHVFLGFKVFGHETWKSWYSAIVSFLFGMVVLLEILTCTTRTH